MESSIEMQTQGVGLEALLDELRAIKLALTVKAIPLEKQLWDKHAVADYLGITPHRFAYVVAPRAGFPKPCDIHKGESKNASGHRWRASEVIAWATAQKV